MNKEHVFPRWLILRTGTNLTGIRWGEKRNVPALAATLPLCRRCNSDFGEMLEGPVQSLFDEVEQGRGLSDEDMELLIRWMWKIQGLAWCATHPGGQYSEKYTLRERVLLPIDDGIRGQLVFGITLFAGLHPDSKDLPMGVDSVTEVDAVFVSGVFSRIAMMVTLEGFRSMIPSQFSQYLLAPARSALNAGKFFYPTISFRDDVEAVGVTYQSSIALSLGHERLARQVQTERAEQEGNRS
jgi:hypothetical protein